MKPEIHHRLTFKTSAELTPADIEQIRSIGMTTSQAINNEINKLINSTFVNPLYRSIVAYHNDLVVGMVGYCKLKRDNTIVFQSVSIVEGVSYEWVYENLILRVITTQKCKFCKAIIIRESSCEGSIYRKFGFTYLGQNISNDSIYILNVKQLRKRIKESRNQQIKK